MSSSGPGAGYGQGKSSRRGPVQRGCAWNSSLVALLESMVWEFGSDPERRVATRDGNQVKLLNRKDHVWVHALGRFLQQPVCGGSIEVRKAQNRETGLEAMVTVQ